LSAADQEEIEESKETISPGTIFDVFYTKPYQKYLTTDLPGLNRRLERRYHTADGIEAVSTSPRQETGILKRFSWSTPAQHLKARKAKEFAITG